jgi:cytochrome b561
MPLRNTEEAYGSVAKFLHWAIVLLILPQYFLAEAAEELPAGLEKIKLMTWHKSFGVLVLVLALARIAWKLANRPYPAKIGLEWQRKAAAISHGLLYLLILVQPVTGWIASNTSNYPVSFFGWFQLPNLVAENKDLHETFEEVHEAGFFTLLAVASVHVAAAFYHHIFLRDNVLRRMLPFTKPAV